MSDFRASIAVYRDRRMFRILLLGAMSGFAGVPILLIFFIALCG